MGNGKALKHILEKLTNNNCSFVETLSLKGQKLDDEALQRIINMLKENKFIKNLNLGLLVFFLSFEIFIFIILFLLQIKKRWS